MSRAVVVRLAILVLLIVWPSFFIWLSEVDGRRWIWSALHDVYYLPFSWVGPPMFAPDPEGGLLVHPTGRAFAVFVYVLVFYVVVRVVDRRKLASAYGKKQDGSDVSPD